ncbi:MAG: fimbrillin family protein [Alistipes sp.]|nr:fimbrillin family protein [Alistipes sp.]
MKKLFVSVLAIAGLVACNMEDTVLTMGPAPIDFDGSFVETRADVAKDPSITTENIKNFDVWGFMDKAEGQIFDGEDVTGEKGNFTYANTQYWVPNHSYYFAAISPMNSENIKLVTPATTDATLGLGVVEFTVTDGAEDFLYSAVGPIAAPAKEATSVAPVKFEFNHMLSKVKFTFTNGFANDLATIDVTNVRMEVPSKGTIKLDQADWWSTNQWVLTNDKTTLAFGDACTGLKVRESQEAANERIVLPAAAAQEYTITFDVKLWQGTVEAYSGTKTVTVKDVALEIGKAYNFKATLSADNITADGTELLPIVFDVEEVKTWVPAGDVDVVGTISGEVEDMTLVTDVVAASTVSVKGAFNGGGHEMSVDPTADYTVSNPGTARLINVAAGATVSNLTIDGGNYAIVKNGESYGIRALFLNGAGNFVIDGVTIENVTYTINDDSAAKTVTVRNSTFQGWTSYNPATVVTFDAVNFIAGGTYNTVRPHGTTTFVNCKFEGTRILLDKLAAENSVVFQGCTYNGQPLVAENLESAAGKNVTIQ